MCPLLMSHLCWFFLSSVSRHLILHGSILHHCMSLILYSTLIPVTLKEMIEKELDNTLEVNRMQKSAGCSVNVGAVCFRPLYCRFYESQRPALQ